MKVALVYSFQDSDWFSCTVILRNLLQSYRELYGEENLFHINYNESLYVKGSDLQTIIDDKIEKIIFLNHKPTPISFLTKLQSMEQELSNKREYIIHVYGDFPLYIQQWRVVFELLKEKPVKLICASAAQKSMIQNLFVQSEIVYECPFPVDQNDFYADENLRSITRSELGIKDDDFVLVYTGRLSYQKRIDKMISNFYGAIKSGHIPVKSKLLLVGAFDNLGILYLGLSKIQGEYFRQIDKVVNSEPELCKQVIFIPEVEHARLNSIYNAADGFYSLGTYHDEDYGMSVAEAICTGLPAVLTKWAGYRSFQLSDHKESCELIPVKLSPNLPVIDESKIAESLAKIMKLSGTRNDRMKTAQSYFSIKNAASILNQILSENVDAFEGRSKLFKRLASENVYSGVSMFKKEKEAAYSDIYYEVYHDYAE